MRENWGLANRRLQPLGHVSAGRSSYKTQALRSNPSCDSGDSCDSLVSARVHKRGHNALLPQVVDQARASGPGDALARAAATPSSASQPPNVVTKVVTAMMAWQRQRWPAIRQRNASRPHLTI